MTNKSNEISQALNYVYRELSKWSLRNAANDNPSAALVFFSFLKYVSDNKQKLSLEFDEKFNFDFLSVLFGERLRKNELVAHIANIEKQLGHGYGILESYASSIDLDSFDRQSTQILDVLNSVDMSDVNDDHLVYEAIVNYFSVTVKKEIRFSGECVTEQNLAKLMAAIGSPVNGSVYDFAVGYGILAAECAKGKDVHVLAQDIDRTCAAVTIMMLTMAGCLNSTVLCGDTIINPLTTVLHYEKTFDCVISSPPFGLKRSAKDATFESGQQADAYEYGLEFKLTGDLTFSRHLIASLRKDGIGVIQVPMGALFRGGMEEKVRANMIRDNYIDAIIELPVGIVAATSIKKALIVFKKNRKEKDIYMLDASREAAKDFIESNGRASVRITDYGVREIQRMVKSREVIEGLSTIITQKELAENNYNLSVGAYLQKSIEQVVIEEDIDALRKNNTILLAKLQQLDKKLNETIERIE
jgi:type I restriction enzyme M protein